MWDWFWNIPMAIGKNVDGQCSLLLGPPFAWWVEFIIPEWLFNKLETAWEKRLDKTFKRS